ATPFYGKPFPAGRLPKAWFRWAPLEKRPPPVLPIAGSIPGTVPVGRQPPKPKAARDSWLRVVKAKTPAAKSPSPVVMKPTQKFPPHFRSFGCSSEQAVDTDVESPEDREAAGELAGGGDESPAALLLARFLIQRDARTLTEGPVPESSDGGDEAPAAAGPAPDGGEVNDEASAAAGPAPDDGGEVNEASAADGPQPDDGGDGDDGPLPDDGGDGDDTTDESLAELVRRQFE
ncbi:unnamed protein product, partial [Symbiodinium sp. CCMP2456]